MAAMLTTRRSVWGVTALLGLNVLLPKSAASWLGAWLQPVAVTALWPASVLRTALVGGDGAGGEDDVVLSGDEALLVELEQLRIENRQLREELSDLSASSELLTREDLKPVRARVTGVTGTASRPTLVIAAGSSQGVGTGMTVVSRRNLVGRVVGEVGLTSATVEPVSASAASLAVVLHSVGGQQRVEMRVTASADGASWTTQIGSGVEARIGDAVTLIDDINFFDATGYTLGVVQKVEADEANPLLLKRVTITPAVPFSSMGRVVVLVSGG